MELSDIHTYINRNELEKALKELDEYIKLNPFCDEAYYLKGNIYRKKGDFRLALNNYLEAIHLNPESQAVHARKMLIDILDFYNKDMYNH